MLAVSHSDRMSDSRTRPSGVLSNSRLRVIRRDARASFLTMRSSSRVRGTSFSPRGSWSSASLPSASLPREMYSARVCVTARRPRRRRSSPTTPRGYSTRQSNKSTTGGGAIYGCRSTAGGSAANPPKNPCIRANNLSTGFAFEFNATGGESAGLDHRRRRRRRQEAVHDERHGRGHRPERRPRRRRRSRGVEVPLAARQRGGPDRGAVGRLHDPRRLPDQPERLHRLRRVARRQGPARRRSRSRTRSTPTATARADPNFAGEVSVARCQTVAVECAPGERQDVNAFVFSARNSGGTATERHAAQPAQARLHPDHRVASSRWRARNSAWRDTARSNHSPV